MFRRSVRFFLVLAACAATTSMTAVAHAEYRPPTELMGKGGPVTPLKNAAMIVKTEGGFRYIAGQQNSHITITASDGRVRYVDTGTRELRGIPRSCSRRSVRNGIAAVCNIPSKFDGKKVFLEVWPRLGNDFVDGSTLSAKFRFWVLADAGFDIVHGGDGDDFVNGAQNNDRAWGGAGDDWIRGGIGDDKVWGGAGADKLVTTDGRDRIHGGDGNDRVYGGSGRDALRAGAGRDTVNCGGGRDHAYIDRSDSTRECESRTRR